MTVTRSATPSAARIKIQMLMSAPFPDSFPGRINLQNGIGSDGKLFNYGIPDGAKLFGLQEVALEKKGVSVFETLYVVHYRQQDKALALGTWVDR